MMIIKENIIIKGVISVTSKLVYLYKNTTIRYNIVRFTRENRINALFLVPLFKIQNNLCIGIKRNKITPMRNDDVDPIKACAYGSVRRNRLKKRKNKRADKKSGKQYM